MFQPAKGNLKTQNHQQWHKEQQLHHPYFLKRESHCAPSTEDISIPGAQPLSLVEQSFAIVFSTSQSNLQQSVTSAQESEATFPNSLNRAVAKLK